MIAADNYGYLEANLSDSAQPVQFDQGRRLTVIPWNTESTLLPRGEHNADDDVCY
jgi:hypothetical protein